MKLIWHESPDQAVAKRCRELEEIRLKEGQTVYWLLVRELLRTDPWFLFRVALEWAWLDEDLVGCKFIRHVADNYGSDLGILFPRGHGKTLPMSGLVISSIINNPNVSILELSRTEDNAKKIGKTIADYLMYNDYLQQCFGRNFNDDGFLPSSSGQCSRWGNDGYVLPWRKPRLDPTLLCIPLDGAKAGKHPDWIWIDDPTEKENNDESGWANVSEVVQGLWFLPPAHGFMVWTGTRWHDGDPLGKAERGKLVGKQGPFKFIRESCYIDDNPKKGPTYAAKKRWNMDVTSGYTLEALDAKRKPESEGGLGQFFDAQMRNDPLPPEKADINVKDILLYDEETETPKLSDVRLFGIEVTGGGLPIYNGFQEWLDTLKIQLPLVQITNPRQRGVDKRDRLVATLQPIVSSGRLRAQDWMIGESDSRDTLGYEIRRLGKAQHDDIVDALHNVPLHLIKGVFPKQDKPADLYIAADLAWTEERKSDWTVVMAVAVDHKKNFWIIDYDRFQLSSPTAIYQRFLEFYNRFKEYVSIRKLSSQKYPGTWK